MTTLGSPGLVGDRQFADAPPGGGENRVGQRRHYARRSWFPDASGRLEALHEMHVDSRRLVDPQHAVVTEVTLLHPAILDRDLAVQGACKAENDPAFHLRPNRVGVYGDATIDDAPHARRIHGAVPVDADLDHLGDEAAEADAERDATALPDGKRLSPTGLLRRDLQNVPRARVLVEQRDAVGNRILLRVRRQLVDEALHDKRAARRPHATPPGRRDSSGGGLLDPLDMDVAESIRLVFG